MLKNSNHSLSICLMPVTFRRTSKGCGLFCRRLNKPPQNDNHMIKKQQILLFSDATTKECCWKITPNKNGRLLLFILLHFQAGYHRFIAYFLIIIFFIYLPQACYLGSNWWTTLMPSIRTSPMREPCSRSTPTWMLRGTVSST